MTRGELATFLALLRVLLEERGALPRFLGEFFGDDDRGWLKAYIQAEDALARAGFYDATGPALYRAIDRAIAEAER